MRPGAGRWAVEARISRAVYYELVALAEPGWVGGRRMLGVWSCGTFFPLGELPPDDGKLDGVYAPTGVTAGHVDRAACDRIRLRIGTAA